MENRKAGPLILSYLNRSAFSFSLTKMPVIESIGQVIVIPCFEEPEIQKTLQSLMRCANPKKGVLVIVVLNQPASSGQDLTEGNSKSKLQIQRVKKTSPNWLQISLVEARELPDKKAGVGLARKIGMDLAIGILQELASPSAPLVCLDADCIVDENYLQEIEDHFIENPKTPACSIHFEHKLDGPNAIPIQNYELQLRYYIEALSWAGFPYSFHTVGSSMAVRAYIYAKQGGMNQRKAGEDFYFLHKVIPLGGYTELNSTRVIPSDRISNRVPFGTGRAMENFKNGKDDLSNFYDLRTFHDLKSFLSRVSDVIDSEQELKRLFLALPKSIKEFIGNKQWEKKIEEIFQNTAERRSRTKRFHSWINAFWILKFTHYSRDNFYPNSDLLKNSLSLFRLLDQGEIRKDQENIHDLLILFRKRHKP